MTSDRLQTRLMIDGVTSQLSQKGIFFYIPKTGDPHSGQILVHVNDGQGKNILWEEGRDLEGTLIWRKKHDQDFLDDVEASKKISSSTSFDEDMWVLEIEDKNLQNPFDKLS